MTDLRRGRALGAVGGGLCLLRGAVVSSALLALALPAVAAEAPAPSPDDYHVQVDALLSQAKNERAAGRLDRARTLCERAIALAPGDADARAELARIDAVATGGDRRSPPGEIKPAATELRLQVIVSDARVAADRAELLEADGRHADAAAALEPAIAALAQVENELPPEHRQELARLRDLDQGYRAESARADAEGKRSTRSGTLSVARGRTATEQQAKRSVFEERLARVQAMRARAHLEVALSAARQLVSDYPAEPAADELFRAILHETHEQRRLSLDERKLELQKEVMERIERSLIPDGFDGMPVYPSDFLSRHGQAFGLEAVPETPAWKEAILDSLSKRVTLDFDAQNGIEAVVALGRQANVNLVVDPQLQAGGDRPVTIKAANIRLDHALDWITRLMDTKWTITKGAIYVGGAEEIEPILAVHDISVLVFQGGDHAGKVIAFSAANGNNGTQSLFQNAGTDEKQVTPEEVVDLLQKSVSPTTWTKPEYGITVRGNTLFVTAPQGVHKLIDEFIRAQERLQNVQVKVDARWLEINDGYIEEIGVNWGNLARNSVFPNTPADPLGFFKENDTISAEGSYTNQLPATQTFIQPATAGTGLTLSAAMLRSPELKAVLEAVERTSQGRLLASPCLTTLNGVQSTCFFGTQIAYIADYEVVSATLDPKIQVLNIGASLTVKPLVSADRKYVTMEFRPAYATAQFFTEVLFANRVVQTGNATFFGPPVAYPIELPNVQIREVSTTVRVPDQASLLVGGFGKTIDQETAERIPFLGNIPFVGRLFGKRGRYSERSKLYLLATVNIITYDELEARL